MRYLLTSGMKTVSFCLFQLTISLYLAEKNLSLRPKLEQLRDQVTASFNQTQQAMTQFNDLLKKQADLYQVSTEALLRSIRRS